MSLVGRLGTAFAAIGGDIKDVRGRLDTVETTMPAMLGAIGALEHQSASIEDLFVTTTITPRAATIAESMSLPIMVAPFPLDITSITLVAWQGVAIVPNDTNYWIVRCRIMDAAATGHRSVAVKTTRATAGEGLPAGETIPVRAVWSFDTATFVAPQAVVREVVNFEFTPVGAPGPITGPMVVTMGYRPR